MAHNPYVPVVEGPDDSATRPVRATFRKPNSGY